MNTQGRENKDPLFALPLKQTHNLAASSLTASTARCSSSKQNIHTHKKSPTFIIMINTSIGGTLLVVQLVEALRYKPEGRGIDSRWCHWNFSLTYSCRPHYGLGVDSASNRNEYQKYFLGVKAAGA
jgi:hypothetical protein